MDGIFYTLWADGPVEGKFNTYHEALVRAKALSEDGRKVTIMVSQATVTPVIGCKVENMMAAWTGQDR